MMSETTEQFKTSITCPYCNQEHEDVLDMGLNPFLCGKCRKLSVIAIKMVPALSYFVEAKAEEESQAPHPALDNEESEQSDESVMTPEEMKAEIRKMQEEIADEEGEILRSAQNDGESAQEGGEGVQNDGNTEEGGSTEAVAELYDLTNGSKGDCHGADAPRSDEGEDSSALPQNDGENTKEPDETHNVNTSVTNDGKYDHIPVKEQEMKIIQVSFEGRITKMELPKKGYPHKSNVIQRLRNIKKKKESVYGCDVKTVLLSIDETTYNEEVK